MARSCNGTNQGFSLESYDLRGSSVLSMSWWFRIGAYGAGSRRMIAHDTGATDNIVFSMDLVGAAVGAGAGSVAVYFTRGAGLSYWMDSFPQPSLDTWHHCVWVAHRGIPSNTVYIDGVAQTMTAVIHDAATYGGWDIRTLWIANRNGALWADVTIAELGIWGSNYVLTARDAAALAAGVSSVEVVPGNLIDYWPLYGADSPEPGFLRGRGKLTLIGTPTEVTPPGVRTLLAQRT